MCTFFVGYHWGKMKKPHSASFTILFKQGEFMKDMTGHRIPNVTFRIRENYKWVTKTTDDFFRDRRVIVFALPGAFTPVCSTLHLPAYNDLYDTLRSFGIDDIYCLAVNDSFVLEAWKKAEKAFKITMLPDVDGEFTRKLGFLVDRNDISLSKRSWRYSMIVNNKVIEEMFIEPEGEGSDPFGESSAEAVLKYLNPSAKMPSSITIFTKLGCEFCEEAKDILRHNRVPFEELILNQHFSIKTVKALSDSTSLPQVFIDGKRISNIQDIRNHFNLRLVS
jgi:glutathione-dependent peroxiredoxin